MTKIKIAAMGDVHMQQTIQNSYKNIFEEISKEADILVLAGDLTDHGTKEEAQMLVEELKSCTIPIVGVLGNHDFTSGHQADISKILSPGCMFLLGDEPIEIKGVGFAGTKGFGGGFGSHMLGAFGEDELKHLVYKTLNESLKLEESLTKITASKKIVVMHYSPVRETLIGESEEIFPFLGSSRLEEPIDNFNVNVVFHGHAHYGSLHGETLKGIPVYNVAIPVLKKINPEKPYLIVEV